ncbi:hypothetical protein HUN08_12245 [Gordonia sp. X0973]|uniref:hypothetical protein n=1 Tax=Gordonia sp. X0973 TaxID=2742602 RepID=UPI000F522529|nr:hypothetical protein [Gordonia sp. X0973]QKT07869.1 hypothetical protein HUN08_12245 [Gordonia sp. X0973]
MSDPFAEAVLRVFLFLDGIIVGILSVVFLTPYIGTTAAPVGILIALVGNGLLLWLATGQVQTPWNWLPVIGWGLVVLVALFGGPGGNVVLPNDWRTPLLFVAGLIGPAVVRGLSAQRERIVVAQRQAPRDPD